MGSLARLRKRADEKDDAESWYQLGVTIGREQDPSDAVDALRIALDRSPSAKLCAAIGQSLETLGDIAMAEHAYRRAIETDPEEADAHGYLGALLLRAGRKAAALRALTRWADLCPEPADAHYKLATLLLAQDDRENAASHLQIAVALDHSHLPALRALGSVYERLGNRTASLRTWETVHRLEPRDTHAAVSYGAALSGMGRHDDAIQLLLDLAKRTHPFWELSVQLGRALRAAGRGDEALTHLRQAEHMAPSVAVVHLEIGQTLEASSHLADAAAAYERALELDARLVEAHYRLGLLLQALGRSDEASQALVRASALSPTDDLIRASLAEVLEAKKAIDGIGGSLSVISLPDLLQFLANSRASGELRIESDTAKASIRLAQGSLQEVVSPSGAYIDEDGMVSGVIGIIKLGGGSFHFEHQAPSGEPGIDHRFVLMEAMRRLDEEG